MTTEDDGISRLDRADAFEEDIGRVFGERARGFSPDLMGMLQSLWGAGIARGIVQGTGDGHARGRQEGYHQRADEEYERGLIRGRQELAVLFSKVISGRKVDDVMRVSDVEADGGRLSTVLHPWVVEAFQKILDAPDLETAARALDPAPDRPFGERFGERLFSDPALASIVRPSVILEEKP